MRFTSWLVPFAAAGVLQAAIADVASGKIAISRDSGMSVYTSTDLGGGCTMNMAVGESSTLNSGYLAFGEALKCDGARPTSATELVVVDALLAAAVADGRDLRATKTVQPLKRTAWVQNYINCYTAANGIDNRKWTSKTDFYDALGGCDITPELNTIFAKYGFVIRLSGSEKAWQFDCRKIGRKNGFGVSDFDPAWLAKYRGHRCALNVGTIWWFKAIPASPH